MSFDFTPNPNQYGRWDDDDRDLRSLSAKSIAELEAIASKLRNPERIDADGNWLPDSDGLPERIFGVATERNEQAVDEDVFSEAGNPDRHYGR